MTPLEKYKLGHEVKLTELDGELLAYILKERWKHLLLFVLMLLFALMVGYYAGYNNAVVTMNEFILENYVNTGVINWTI